MNGHWLTKSRTMRILWLVFAIVLVLSVLTEGLIQPHTRFGIDGSFGFYAWFGGVSCIGIIAVAKSLGIFLKRKDNYYDD